MKKLQKRLLALVALVLLAIGLNEVTGQVIFGAGESGSTPAFTSRQRGSVAQSRIDVSTSSSSDCRTIGGPKIGTSCVFPFKYEGTTYRACPIHRSDGLRWCSTKTDSRGNHVIGQGEYGTCGSGCPLHQEASRTEAFSERIQSESSSGTCSGLEKCKHINKCSGYISPSKIDQKGCIHSDGTQGLCCPDFTKNKKVDILAPEPELDLRDGSSSLSSNTLPRAVRQGQSALANATKITKRISRRPSRGTAAYYQMMNQQRRRGARELNDLAIIAAQAAASLKKEGILRGDEVGIRQADVLNTVLNDCYHIPDCSRRNDRYRTIDGTCNHEFQPLLGSLRTPLQRVLRNDYRDSIREARAASDGGELPSAREISTTTTIATSSLSGRNSMLLMAFGQFLDHDISHVPVEGLQCCDGSGQFDFNAHSRNPGQCMPISIPRFDQFFSRRSCMNFVRSDGAPRFDCSPGPMEQMNQITHWLDSSNVYGSDDEEAHDLRTFQRGLLKSKSSSFGKELLPDDREQKDCRGQTFCFKAGDGRNSEQPNLAVLHTLFLREHNRIARQLARINSHWSDERLYQETRRIVNAEWQHIIYNEFLPVLLGDNYVRNFGLLPLTSGHSSDYLNHIDPTVTNEFATAAFRVGHTLIPSMITVVAQVGRQIGSQRQQFGSSSNSRFNLSSQFFVPDLLRTAGGVDGLLLGLTRNPVELAENNFVDEIRQRLFDGELSGMDLVALNIQRGRDHGLPGYIHYRRICQIDNNNRPITSFSQLSGAISQQNIQRLRNVYSRVEDIDLYTGMYMETPGYNGAFVGPTFLCLIGDQFARLKKGDRYFYDLGNQPGSFTSAQLDAIREVSFSRLVCDNGDNVQSMQPLAFLLPNDRVNRITSCSSFTIPRVDLNTFRESNRG